MNQHDRDALGRVLTEIAFGFDYDLPKHKASIFIDLLIKYHPAELQEYLNAIELYVSDRKNTKFPSVFLLKTYLDKTLSSDAAGNEIASRIRHAISSIGWISPDKAREYIGEVGWMVVIRAGGWQYICENHGTELNPMTFFAQSRESAKSILEQDKKGILNQPIQIESSGSNIIKLAFKNGGVETKETD